jgi:hypothetical protein
MNSPQLITNAEALRLFFNDDVYLVDEAKAQAIEKKEALSEPKNDLQATTNKTGIDTPAYKEPILSLPKAEEPSALAIQQISFKHLGKNEKGILILVNDLQHPVSSPQGTELLRKLVLSINLKNADFALVNYAQYSNVKFSQFYQFFNCNLVLSFGVEAEHLDLPVQTLHQLSILNNIRMIFTLNLHDLDSDVMAKKLLWANLQKL